jgi:hypothetical protein
MCEDIRLWSSKIRCLVHYVSKPHTNLGLVLSVLVLQRLFVGVAQICILQSEIVEGMARSVQTLQARTVHQKQAISVNKSAIHALVFNKAMREQKKVA